MKIKIIATILITIFIVALLSGCVDNTKTETQVTPIPTGVQTPVVKEPEGTIRVSGAFALYPMTVKWAEEFKNLIQE